MSSFKVSTTLEKMDDPDPDFRYMACNDLLAEMAKESFQLDNENQNKIIRKILQLIIDPSGDVSGLAGKVLGPLVKLATDSQIEEIIGQVCNYLEERNPQHRGVAGQALRSVIVDLPASSSVVRTAVKKLTPRLVKACRDDAVVENQLDAIEVMQEFLRKFGQLTSPDHQDLSNLCLELVKAGRSSVRKRAIGAAAYLSLHLNDKLLNSFVSAISSNVSSKKVNDASTAIQAVAGIFRVVGSRLGSHLNNLVPAILAHCVQKGDDVPSEEEEGLLQSCFDACETFLLRYPKDVTPFVGKILAKALEFIKHDPNYATESSDEEGDGDDDDNDDDGDAGDDEYDDYGDDDDVSWKVRRAASKSLSAIICTRSDYAQQVLEQVAPALVKRFKERTENVQEDIFSAFSDVLRHVSNLARHESGVIDKLASLVPLIVRNIAGQLKTGSQKTRTAALSMLRVFVQAVPHAFEAELAKIVGLTAKSITDGKAGPTLRIQGLAFVRALIESHADQAALFQPLAPQIVTFVQAGIKSGYYKAVAESLRLVSALAGAIKPAPGSKGHEFAAAKIAATLFEAAIAQVRVLEIDQEVKESSIAAAGTLAARCGDSLQSSLPDLLKLFVERLHNEITRLVTVEAINEIVTSWLDVDVTPVLAEVVAELSAFLRNKHRALRQSSLTTLNSLAGKYHAKFTGALVDGLLTEIANLVSDSDLFLAHQSLRLCITLLAAGQATDLIRSKILPRALDLVRSPLLQGLALASLIAFFGELVARKSVSFDAVLKQLLATAQTGTANQQSLLPVAKAVAELCVRASQAEADATIARFTSDLKTGSLQVQVLAVLTLGEIGRKVDLASRSTHTAVVDAFQTDSEELKSAASFALGSLALGNQTVFVPFVLQQIAKQARAAQYLLLHSLREIVASEQASAATLGSHAAEMLKLLGQHASAEEEGVRAVVAECLGKLGLLLPSVVVPHLVSQMAPSSAALVRATSVTAVRHAVVERPVAFDDALAGKPIHTFLAAMSDGDLVVRRASTQTLNALGRTKPRTIRPVLRDHLAALYKESEIKPELIREITVGPFKHTVDDGLDNRKAAFETLYTLLDTSIDLLDVSGFLECLASGLSDHYDIKNLSHMMLDKLARTEGTAALSNIERLVDPLNKTIMTKMRDNAVPQDIERNEELIKGALRAIASLSRVPGSDSSPRFAQLVEDILKSDVNALPEKYSAILKATSTD